MEHANWTVRFADVACSHGYRWEIGEIGRWVKPIIDKIGEDKTAKAWAYWCGNAADLGEPRSRMNPASFARMAGYWLHLSSPVKL